MFSSMLYIDPAATTALLSSVTAIAVACGAAFIIMWRKVKQGATTVLHIDENANTEVEAELVITDDETVEAASTDPFESK